LRVFAIRHGVTSTNRKPPVVDAVLVYVAEATALLVCPVAVAMALIVSVADTATAAVYFVDAVVGVVPLVV